MNSFGRHFRVTTFGESHGVALGAVVDGCPALIDLNESDLQSELDRRKPGQSNIATPRFEEDRLQILSGVFEGKTTGTPIMIMVQNKDADSKAYSPYADVFRPGHGDITYQAKYGIRDWRGGGRASARETVARVAAGAVAGAVLEKLGISITAYTLELGGIRAQKKDFDDIPRNPFFCCDNDAAGEMEKRVTAIKKKGDSIGGIVEIQAEGVPKGLGDPVFDKLDADLAKAIMSIGAVKGVEIGAGFQVAKMRGSENNDEITPEGFLSNNAGGILAGISNAEPILIRAAVKPIPSIQIEQQTIDRFNQPQTLSVRGRHDISPIPRINVVCEAMIALVLVDHLLRQKAIR